MNHGMLPGPDWKNTTNSMMATMAVTAAGLLKLAVLQGYGENESAARYSSQAEQVQEPPAGFLHQRDGDGAEDDVHRAQAARQRLTRSSAHPGLLEHLTAEIEHRVDA